MQAVNIRAVQADDFEQWKPLWRDYLGFYGEQENEQVTRATWQRFLDKDEPMHALLAVSNGEVAGFAHLIGHRSTWSEKNRLYLNDLFVSESQRQKGLARQLVEQARHFAQTYDYDWLYWTTREGNTAAQALYNQVADRTDFLQYRMFTG